MIKVSGGSTAVPNFFIDEYMPRANAEFVKVYIFALRNAGADLSDGLIAQSLGILESDVVKAWSYWIDAGIVARCGDDLVFLSEKPSKISEPLEEKPVRVSSTRSEIAKAFKSDNTLSALCSGIQGALGKTLSPSELSSLYSIYTELKMPAEVIILLVEYCKARGKESMKYIEKVAVGWKQDGIDNIEAVENFCRLEEEFNRDEAQIKSILGIRADRKLTESEKKYIRSWHTDMGFPPEVIGLAYDQTMLNTGKLSWPYLNTILKNWHSKGVKSATDIKSERAEKRSKNKFNNFSQADDDTASAEQAAIRRRMQKQGVK